MSESSGRNQSATLRRPGDPKKAADKGSAEPVPGKCGHRLRLSDPPRYCTKDPVAGREACRLHGGMAPRGVAAPAFRHGKYSQHLPARYQSAVSRALSDPDYLSVREDVGLLDARTSELLGAMETGASLEQAKLAAVSLSHLVAAMPAEFKAHPAVGDLRDALLGTVQAAKAEATAWREIRNNQRVRARLAEVERRTQERLGNMMPAEQVMALVAVLAGIVHEEVPDIKLRQRISDRLFAVGAVRKGDVVDAEVVRDSRVLTDGRTGVE